MSQLFPGSNLNCNVFSQSRSEINSTKNNETLYRHAIDFIKLADLGRRL